MSHTSFRRELRYELKYLLRRSQVDAVLDEVRTQMRLDPHCVLPGDGQDGVGVSYPITSLYYDTPDYKAYWDKLDGQRNRRKVRVRAYGDTQITPDTLTYLEIKQRVNQMMRKRRVRLPYAQAVDFAALAELGSTLDDPARALVHEVAFLYATLQLRPACVVTYDRLAFEGDAHAPDLRVTLDTNVRGRIHDLSLLSTGSAADRHLLGPDYAVLEVKANSHVPGWVAQMVARHHCTFRRVSKYCLTLEGCQAIAGRQHWVDLRPDQTAHPAQ
jgi:SPX domain protein involved in polyphosphate accumulation